MSDLTTKELCVRLRKWHALKGESCFREAADEIERLQRRVAELLEARERSNQEIVMLRDKLDALSEPPSDVQCDWTYDADDDVWSTGCHQMHCFNVDGPTENEFKWCPYCRQQVNDVRPSETKEVAQTDERGRPMTYWGGRAAETPPQLCGHDDGGHCDETCAEKVRAFREYHGLPPPPPSFCFANSVERTLLDTCKQVWDGDLTPEQATDRILNLRATSPPPPTPSCEESENEPL